MLAKEELQRLSIIVKKLKNNQFNRDFFCNNPYGFLTDWGITPVMGLFDPLENLNNSLLRFLENDFEQTILSVDYLYTKKSFDHSPYVDMDTLLLCNGSKKGVRLCVSEMQLASIIRLCAENNLFYLFSPYKMSICTDVGKNGYSNCIEQFFPLCDPNPGILFVYISPEPQITTLLWFTELLGLHRQFGRLLGYPECCISFYEKNIRLANEKHQGEFVSLMPTSQDFAYPFYTNNLLRYFGIHLISHFPCNYHCRPSIEIGMENYRGLLASQPDYMKQVKKSLQTTVLYSDTQGVFILKEAYWDSDHSIKYRTENILSTIKENKIFRILTSSDRILINDGRINMYNGVQYKGELPHVVKILRFTDPNY